MSHCDCSLEIKEESQKKTLLWLLLLNVLMFFAEFIGGVFGKSTALIADSFDMFADASIYSLSLYAVGRADEKKSQIAFLIGVLQIVLGLGVLGDVIRRSLYGNEPQSFLMISLGFVALIVNIICFILITKHRQGGVHMRASWICSRNDVLANIGIIFGGILVFWTNSFLPDLLIGFLILLVVLHGGISIIKESKRKE